MTALQESARKSFEAWKKTGSCFYLSRNNAPGSDLDGYQDAYTQGQWVAWQAALEQHEADKPFQPDWTNYRQGVEDGKAEALAQQELPQKERPDFMAGYDAGMADAKRMAQHGEPTDDQLVKGVKAMRLFVTKNSVADFKLGYIAALAAAPAPQPAKRPRTAVQGIALASNARMSNPRS